MLDARPDVLNHNTETVPRLYRMARSGGKYTRTPGTARSRAPLRARHSDEDRADGRPRRRAGRARRGVSRPAPGGRLDSDARPIPAPLGRPRRDDALLPSRRVPRIEAARARPRASCTSKPVRSCAAPTTRTNRRTRTRRQRRSRDAASDSSRGSRDEAMQVSGLSRLCGLGAGLDQVSACQNRTAPASSTPQVPSPLPVPWLPWLYFRRGLNTCVAVPKNISADSISVSDRVGCG